jgi:hypothetical protein
MKSFDKEIKQFLIDGAFNNNLDDAGNINLSIDPIDVNQRYIEFGLKNYLYNNDQIAMLYDVEIKEFSIPTNIIPVNNSDNNTSQLVQENESLRNQLNAVISADNQNSASAVVDASKDVIIKLRIKLNEGKLSDDFSDAFPYLKK